MPWSYRPSLDGLRTLAMYLIILFHADVAWAKGGFIAVNLFFVLSGYLVTNVILSEIDRTGTLRLGAFYARRVRRLLPAAVAAIVGTSLLFLLVVPVVRRLSLVGDAQSALLYVANWRFIHQASDYFATDVEKSPFLHFWSLGIEEQFYAAFPIVLLLLVRSARRWIAFAGLMVVFVASLVSQIIWARIDETYAYFATDARLYQLVAGALVAVAFRTWSIRLSRQVSVATALVGMLGFLAVSAGVLDLSTSTVGIIGTAACTLIIVGLMQAEDQPLGRLLARPTPVYLGKISYATYLWHWPAILVLQMVLDLGALPVAVLAAVLATAMAAASAELLETPIRRSALLDRFAWRTVTVGVVTSALVAVTAVPWLLERDRRPALRVALEAPASAAASEVTNPRPSKAKPVDTRMPHDIDWKQVEEDKGLEHSCAPSDPSDCTVVEGSGPHILLVGDSHAQMLGPMFESLAREKDFTLSVNVVGGCPWQEGLANVQVSPELQEECTDARVGWYDEALPELRPDLVVIANFPRDGSPHLKRRDGRREPSNRAILRESQATLEKIADASARTLLIESMIVPSKFKPNDCLTSTEDPEECSVVVPPRNRASDGIYLAAAAETDDVFTVDLNPAFCPAAPVCHAVIDGQVVWRDKHHLAPAYAESRRDKAWNLIRRTGALEDVEAS